MWQPCTVWPSSTIHNQHNSQWRAGRHADPIQHLQRHQKTPSSHWELATAGCHRATYIRISSQDFWQGWVSLHDGTLWTHFPTTDHTRHFSNLTSEADDSGSRKPVKTVMAMNQSDTAAMTTVIILGFSYSHCESKCSNKQEWQFWNTSITFKVLLLVRALWRLSQCQPDFWLNCFTTLLFDDDQSILQTWEALLLHCCVFITWRRG